MWWYTKIDKYEVCPCVVNDHQQHMRPNPFVKTQFGVEMIICKIMLMDIGDKNSNEL